MKWIPKCQSAFGKIQSLITLIVFIIIIFIIIISIIIVFTNSVAHAFDSRDQPLQASFHMLSLSTDSNFEYIGFNFTQAIVSISLSLSFLAFKCHFQASQPILQYSTLTFNFQLSCPDFILNVKFNFHFEIFSF